MRPLFSYVSIEALGALARLELCIQVAGTGPNPVRITSPSNCLAIEFCGITPFGGTLNNGCACQCQSAVAGTIGCLANIACIRCGKRRGFACINHQLKLCFEWGNLGQSRSCLGFHHVVLVSRQCDGSQNADDRHNDHQFDQGETLLHGTDSTVHNTSPQNNCNESRRGISPDSGSELSRFHATLFLQRFVAFTGDYLPRSRAKRPCGSKG